MVLFPAAILFQLLYYGWVAEDAYLTFRTIDNFLNGYGLRWNIDERVQAYTHPLWMLLHIPFAAFTGELFFTSIALGITCSLAAYFMLFFAFRRHMLIALGIVSLPLCLSYTWNVYGTSGLENSLNHLLMVCFCLCFLKQDSRTPWFTLSFIASLSVLNRMDTVLLFITPMFALMLANRGNIRWKHCLFGTIPLLLWVSFSFFYYGTPFPNTKYAKLSTDIPSLWLWKQGLHYFLDFVRNDLVSAVIILAGIITSYTLALSAFKRGSIRQNYGFSLKLGALGSSVLIYLFYIAYVGGDYMSGRFFSTPLILAVIILSFSACHNIATHCQRLFIFDIVMLVIIAALIGSHTRDIGRINAKGIANEWLFYKQTHRLLPNIPYKEKLHSHIWVKKGLSLRNRPPNTAHVYSNAGMVPYFAGPKVTVIDPLGLADPLLARLPLNNPKHWRVGHYIRLLPVGYAAARLQNDPSTLHPSLAAYYSRLRFITQGPLFHWARIKEAIKLQFTTSSDLEKYIQDEIRRTTWPLNHFDKIKVIHPNKMLSPADLSDAHNLILNENTTYTLKASHVIHPTHVDVGLRERTAFRVKLYLGNKYLHQLWVEALPQSEHFDDESGSTPPIRHVIFSLPKKVTQSGVDRVTIMLPEDYIQQDLLPPMMLHLLLR